MALLGGFGGIKSVPSAARCSPAGSVLSRAHIYGYGRSLRPPQRTTSARRRRALSRQTLLGSQLLEHDLRGRLLGGLLRAAVPDPGLLAVHVGGTGEGAVMRRPVDIEHRIAHRLPAPRERLLNLGLEIDVTGQRVLDPRRE